LTTGSDDDAEVVSLEDVELLDDEALGRGRDLLIAGDAVAAITAFEQALSEDPRSAEALHGLAKALRWSDPPRARAALERAVAIRPTFFEAWRALGLLSRALGDEAGARRAAVRARDCAPSVEAAAALQLDVPSA
jgi:Flp pilus assembly protein TadD